jgi:hypothetical protein
MWRSFVKSEEMLMAGPLIEILFDFSLTEVGDEESPFIYELKQYTYFSSLGDRIQLVMFCNLGLGRCIYLRLKYQIFVYAALLVFPIIPRSLLFSRNLVFFLSVHATSNSTLNFPLMLPHVQKILSSLPQGLSLALTG